MTLLAGRALTLDTCRVRYGPRGCHDDTYEGVLVTCNGQGEVSEIPSMIPSESVYISFTNFRFDSLSRANFSKFRLVQCMSIIDSGITDLDADTFADMESLNELELHNTNMVGEHLSFISHPTFKPVRVSVTGTPSIQSLDFRGSPLMEKLTGLNLKGNGITAIDPSIFSALKNLVSLDLSDNRLTTLEWDKLSDMSKLNELYLSGNSLQNIPQRVFRTFFAVKELKIAGNPFHCNCNLHWLKRFYEDTSDRILDLAEVQCASPFEKLLIEATDEQFSCSKPAWPVIEWHSLPGSDGEFAFNCSSAADPAPTLTFTFPKDLKVITPPSEDLSKLKTSTPRIISKPGDIGCIATNSEGSSARREIVPLTGMYGHTDLLQLLIAFSLPIIKTTYILLFQPSETHNQTVLSKPYLSLSRQMFIYDLSLF